MVYHEIQHQSLIQKGFEDTYQQCIKLSNAFLDKLATAPDAAL